MKIEMRIEPIRKDAYLHIKKELEESGFDYVRKSGRRVVARKETGSDLFGRSFTICEIEIKDKWLRFDFSEDGLGRVDGMRIFLNVLRLMEGAFMVSPSSAFEEILRSFNIVVSAEGKEKVELEEEISALRKKLETLERKYHELVKASEQNSQLLIECERKREELSKRLAELESISRDALKEELFKWVKMHGGKISVSEFSKEYSVPISLVEEGLNDLVVEGYLKVKK